MFEDDYEEPDSDEDDFPDDGGADWQDDLDDALHDSGAR
jgi:hypothetical protein